MTGLHTGHCLIRGNSKDNLRPEDTTVAEVLSQAGYRCGLMGKWGLGHEGSSGVPTRQGFHTFFGYLDQHHAHNYYPTFLIQNDERFPLANVVPNEDRYGSGKATKRVDYSHDLIAERALQFIRDNREGPFFLYLAFTIPHANNEARDEGMEVPDLGDYRDKDWPAAQKGHAAMISRMDRDIGRLFDLLKELGIDENTIVFFTSDNGPHREGGNNPEFANSNGPLTGMKRSLHEGGIRVPMLVRWPEHVAAGAVETWVGANWDILPTLAELAEANDNVPPGLDGISFAPLLLGNREQQRQHDYLYWAFYEQGGGQAVRVADWKAIEQPIGTPIRLYHLAEDLAEQHDLAAQNPALVQVMSRVMDGANLPSPNWKFPQADRQRAARRPAGPARAEARQP